MFTNAKAKKLVFQDSAYPHPPAKKMCHCILSLVTLVTMYTYMVWIVLNCSGLCMKFFLGLVGIISDIRDLGLYVTTSDYLGLLWTAIDGLSGTTCEVLLGTKILTVYELLIF